MQELGRGQFGSVWLAKWLGVDVAIKELHSANTPRSRREMIGEAQTLASLRHPCVIAFYGVVINGVRLCNKCQAATCIANTGSVPACFQSRKHPF